MRSSRVDVNLVAKKLIVLLDETWSDHQNIKGSFRVKSFNYLTETVFFRKSENLTETFFFSSTFCELFFCL